MVFFCSFWYHSISNIYLKYNGSNNKRIKCNLRSGKTVGFLTTCLTILGVFSTIIRHWCSTQAVLGTPYPLYHLLQLLAQIYSCLWSKLMRKCMFFTDNHNIYCRGGGWLASLLKCSILGMDWVEISHFHIFPHKLTKTQSFDHWHKTDTTWYQQRCTIRSQTLVEAGVSAQIFYTEIQKKESLTPTKHF